MDERTLSRRDALKITAVAPRRSPCRSRSISAVSRRSQLPASRLPRPFTAASSYAPRPEHRRHARLAVTTVRAHPAGVPQRRSLARTSRRTMWGYNGMFPGPDDPRAVKDEPITVRQINQLPRRASRPWATCPTTSTHLHGMHPSLPAVRRLCRRPDAARVSSRTTCTSNDPGRPDALVPRPRRPPHRGEHLHGPGRPYHVLSAFPTPSSPARSLPSGEFEVPLIINDVAFAADGPAAVRRPRPRPACSATSSW